MSEEKSSCPYCKGKLFISMGFTEKLINGRKAFYPYAQPCYCELNKYISKQFGMLSTLPDASPDDSKEVFERYAGTTKNKGNFIFYGDEEAFRYTVKCYFLRGCISRDYQILEGVKIIDKYNVVKDDGIRLTISVLDQYALVAILFTSRSEPPTLKPCIADLVKSRYRISHPTWIYATDEATLKNSKEYSKDLDVYLESYGKVDLSRTPRYKNFSKGLSKQAEMKNAQKLNDDLGKIR